MSKVFKSGNNSQHHVYTYTTRCISRKARGNLGKELGPVATGRSRSQYGEMNTQLGLIYQAPQIRSQSTSIEVPKKDSGRYLMRTQSKPNA